MSGPVGPSVYGGGENEEVFTNRRRDALARISCKTPYRASQRSSNSQYKHRCGLLEAKQKELAEQNALSLGLTERMTTQNKELQKQIEKLESRVRSPARDPEIMKRICSEFGVPGSTKQDLEEGIKKRMEDRIGQDYERMIDQLQQDLRDAQDRLRHHEETPMPAIREAVEDGCPECFKFQEKIQYLEQTNAALDEDVSKRFQRRLDTVEELRKRMQQSHERQVHGLEQTTQRLRSERDFYREKEVLVTDEKADLQERYEDLESRFRRVSVELEEAKGLRDRAECVYLSNTTSKKLEARMRELVNERNKLQADLQDSQDIVAAERERNTSHERAIAKMDSQKQAMRRKLEECEAHMSELNGKHLEHESSNRELRTEVANLQSQIREMNTKNETLRKDSSELRIQVSTATGVSKNNAQDKVSLQAKIEELSTQNGRLESQLANADAFSKEKVSLQAKIEELSTQNGRLESQLANTDAFSKENVSLQAKIEELSAENGRLESQLKASSQKNGEDIAELRDQKNRIDEQLRKSRAESQELRETLESSRCSEPPATADQTEMYEKEIKDLQARLEGNQSAIVALRNEREDLSKQVETLTDRNETLTTANDKLLTKQERAAKEHESGRGSKESLKDVLQKAMRLCQTVQTELPTDVHSTRKGFSAPNSTPIREVSARRMREELQRQRRQQAHDRPDQEAAEPGVDFERSTKDALLKQLIRYHELLNDTTRALSNSAATRGCKSAPLEKAEPAKEEKRRRRRSSRTKRDSASRPSRSPSARPNNNARKRSLSRKRHQAVAAQAKQRLRAAEKKSAELQKENEQLQKQASKLRAATEQFRKVRESVKAERARSDAMKAENAAVRKENEDYKAKAEEMARWEHSKLELEKRCREARAKMRDIRQDCDITKVDLLSERDRLREKLKRSDEQIQTWQEKCRQFEETNKALNGDNEELRQKLEDECGQSEQILQQYHEQRDRAQQAEDDLRRLQVVFESLGEAAELQDANKDLLKKLQASEQQMAQAKDQLASSEAQIESLEAELKKARTESEMFKERAFKATEQTAITLQHVEALKLQTERNAHAQSGTAARAKQAIAAFRETQSQMRRDFEGMGQVMLDARNTIAQRLGREIHSLKEENQRLQEELSNATARFSADEQRRLQQFRVMQHNMTHTLQPHLKGLQAKISEMTTENERIKKQHAEQLEANGRLEERVCDAEKKSERLALHIKDVESKNHGMSLRMAELLEGKKTAEEKLSSSQSDVLEFHRVRKILPGDTGDVVGQVTKLKEDLEQSYSQIRDLKSSEQERIDRQVQELKRELSSSRGEKRAALQKATQQAEQLQELEQEIARLRDQHGSYQTQASTHVDDLIRKAESEQRGLGAGGVTKSQLVADFGEVVAERDSLKQENRKLQQELAKAQSQIANGDRELRRKYRDVTRESETLTKQANALANQVDVLKREARQRQEELDAANERIASLNKELLTHQSDPRAAVAEIQRETSELQRANRELKEKLAGVQNDLSSLQIEYDSQVRRLEEEAAKRNVTIAKLETQVQNLQAERNMDAHMRDQIGASAQQIEILEKAKQSAETAAGDYLERARKEHEESKALREQVKALREQGKGLREQGKGLREQNAALRADLGTLKHALEDQKARATELMKQKDDGEGRHSLGSSEDKNGIQALVTDHFGQKLNQMEQERNRLHHINKRLERELHVVKREAHAQRELFTNLRKEFDATKGKLMSEVAQAKTDWKREVTQWQQRFHNAKKERDAAIARWKEQDRRYRELEGRLAAIDGSGSRELQQLRIAYKQQLDQKNGELEAAQRQREKSKLEMSALKDERSAQNSKCDQLRQQLGKMEIKAERWRTQRDYAKSKYKEIRIERDELHAAVDMRGPASAVGLPRKGKDKDGPSSREPY